MISWLNKLGFLIALLMLPAGLLFAEGYVQLVGIPNLPINENTTTNQYVNALYNLSIGVAALLAVVKIIFAGAKYILSDVVTTKESAKKDIQNSILGLFIVLSAVLLLQTINKDLTNLDILADLPVVSSTLTFTPPDTNPQTNPVECERQGGTFSNTETNSLCDFGVEVDIGLDDSGAVDDEERRLLCARNNLEYNEITRECQRTGENIIPFPASATSEIEQRIYCSSIDAEYRPELNGCVPRN